MATPLSPTKLIKRKFATNEKAWTHAYNYFRHFLPIILRAYATAKKKTCVVFDIDFTVLHYSSPLNTRELRLSSPHALKLYDLFCTNNVPIYFVTARVLSKLAIDITRQELEHVGFKDYTMIYFMPSAQDNVGYYKETMRDVLRSQYHILFNAGDQWTDICNRPVENEEKYNDQAYMMYGVEPGCDWGLKLISHQEPAVTIFSKRPPHLDAVFDTVRDPFVTKPEDACSSCGAYHLSNWSV